MAHIEPDEDEEFIPKPRGPQGPKPRTKRLPNGAGPGRPRQLGSRLSKRKRKSKDPIDRLSPSQRPNARWITIMLPKDAYVQLQEIAKFRGLSLSKAAAQIIAPEFDKVYEESMLLLRIAQRRRKEEEEREALRRNNPTRRDHF